MDVAINPDFSQVESDDPQVTANQRFEVFFPDPQFGVRLTGKSGPYAIGALMADDQSPGREVPFGDPIDGRRAKFGVLRINRDISRESTIGMIYTDREFLGSYNRVAGVDARIKLNPNWVVSMQAVTASTQFLDGTHTGGPAYDVEVEQEGRKMRTRFAFNDRSPGFDTLTGFLPGASRRSFRKGNF